MKLSLQDRVALIYTSQGSQRKVGALLGISHQRVGRILHGYSPPAVKAPKTAHDARVNELHRIVDAGFSKHKKAARKVAADHGLPFDSKIPVYAARMPMVVKEKVTYDDGSVSFEPVLLPNGKPKTKPGDRIAAKHTHWLSDRLREAWIAAMQRSGRFIGVSIRSIINLALYGKQADDRHRKTRKRVRTETALTSKRELAERAANFRLGAINTRYTPMSTDFSIDAILRDVAEKLIDKHEPATGEPGTRLADEILLQWNARNENETIDPSTGEIKKRNKKRR